MRILVPLIIVAAESGPLAAQTPEQRYFDWTDLQFPTDEYQVRRDRLLESLRASGGGILLAPSGDGVSQGETFRPEEDFLYFTGLELPNSILVVDAEAERVIVFAPHRDPRFSSASRPNDFPGRPLADDPTLARRSGLGDVRPFSELEGYIRERLAGDAVLRVNAGRPGDINAAPIEPIRPWRVEDGLAAWLQNRFGLQARNAYEAIARVRMVKSEREIALMRRAATITMDAIRHAARFIGPGVDERTLEGELELAYKRAGAQRPAFASIVKSGPNSLWPWRILASHYDRRNRQMEAGDLVIFDVGAEYNYYVSDVGRTFPVSGSFTAEQRTILEMEVAVSDAIIAAARPGRTFADLQRVADAAIPAEHKTYMQTGLFFGHHLGLDTGDPNLPDAPLAPGMIFTVEPWYYNHDLGISVFTEDEVLVTADGVEVLTAGLPRTPEGLERMVSKSPEPGARRRSARD